MKKLVLFFFTVVSISVYSQSDSLKFAALDSLSPEQLLDYYINEPEPIQFYKGPVEIGDSAFKALSPLVAPTETVNADPLFRYGLEESEPDFLDSTSRAEQALKPKVAIGFGKMGYSGDLYVDHFQNALLGRPAMNLDISQRLTHYLQLDFTVLFGKVGANENLPDRHQNFVSEIRSGGLNLLYDFGNFIPARYRVRPFVSFGVSGFEYLSKTDIKDKDGKTYFYWSDGSIKDKAEGSAEAQNAVDLVRDYTYESDIRELNVDGFGKYSEKAVAFPFGFGVVMKITDRVDMKLNWQYFVSSTDYIDGITEKSVGTRAGNKKNDNLTYTSFALQYDLITKTSSKSKQYADTLTDAFWLALNAEDEDKDSIPDLKDNCLGTVAGAKVDLLGCALDDDQDGIPNYRDDEPNTVAGTPVNARGVSQDTEYWQTWYDGFMNDSIAVEKETKYVTNAFAADAKKEKKRKKDEYTVELVRYTGPIPSDELAYLLSVGDINSTTLDDGKTVVYTTGKYDNLADAIKRKEEFKLSGNKSAKVAKVQGNNFQKIEEEDLDGLLRKELEDLMNLSISEDGDTLYNPLDSNDIFNRIFDDKSFAGWDAAKKGKMVKALKSGDTSVFNDESFAGWDAAKKDSVAKLIKAGKSNPSKAAGAVAQADSSPEETESFGKEDIVYRVQLGAFRNKISTSVFNTSTSVLELKTSENIYRYVTKGYKSIEQAAGIRADLVIQGYSDAFVTAYKEGKRVPLNQTKATVDKAYVEDMNEDKIFSSVDKSLVAFKVQLGAPLKKQALVSLMEEKIKDLGDIEKQTTSVGGIRYTSGNFASYSDAEKHRKQLEDKGFFDAFIIATFKNVQIPIQEAMELLK